MNVTQANRIIAFRPKISLNLPMFRVIVCKNKNELRYRACCQGKGKIASVGVGRVSGILTIERLERVYSRTKMKHPN